MRQVTRGLTAAAVVLLAVAFSLPAEAASTLSRLPLVFEPNVGQAPADIRYVSHTAGHRLWLGVDEARFVSIPTRSGEDVRSEPIRIRWIGGMPASSVAGADEQPGKAHYYHYLARDPHASRQNVPMYGRVVYRGVYPGVDVVFHGTQRDAEFDFVIHPGGDPRAVRLEVTGADELALEADDLVIRRGATRLRLHKPVVYQDTPAGRVPVAGRFTLSGRHVAFDVGAYDRSRALVIDPVLTYSSYLNASDIGRTIGVDSALNMYVALRDRVVKLSADGATLVYSTVIGDITPQEIAVDAAGNAYLAANCPYNRSGLTFNCATTNALASGQPRAQGDSMGIVYKLRPDGTLVASTTIGGNGSIVMNGIAVDPFSNIYITGWNAYGGFPQTSGAFGPPPGAAGMAFVQAIAADFSRYIYAGAFAQASDGSITPEAIAVDAAGAAYITGVAATTQFPTTAGSFQPTTGGAPGAGFVAKIAPDGSRLVYATYLGNQQVSPRAIAVDGSGNAYIAGHAGAGLPTLNAIQTTPAGVADAFVTKLNPAGSALVFSTYLGGGADDAATGVGIDTAGNVYVAGATDSTDFPQKNAMPTQYGSAGSNFVTALTPNGIAFVYSTYFADPQTFVGGMAVSPGGAVFLTGTTNSAAYPTVKPYQGALTGSANAFVARIDPGGSTGTCGTGQFFAEYFSNITLTPPAARTQCEGSINYDWGIGGPAGVPPDNFSARWTGRFNFAGGSVTFTARADDGVRVYLDGTLIIDGWKDQPATTYTATRTVTAGEHEVKVEYYEKLEAAVIQVGWTGGGGSGCQSGLFFAEYFSNTTLAPPATRTACEGAPNYTWGAGGPAGLPVDNFSARWTGSPTFSAGSYTFTVRADDGVRLFLDGTLIIDGWKDQPATTYTTTRALSTGPHQIKIEYYERGGDAVIQVAWGGSTSAPTLTSLTPSSATAGGPAFTLTANGTSFVTGATVLWNGAARTTTFVSSTQLTASIPASDLAAAGSVPVTVRNPDGQTSAARTFTINPSGGGGGDTIKVFITEPANGSTVRGTVWFTVWVENAAAGSKTVTLSVDGTTITSTTGTANGPYSLPWSTTTADNGSRTATISVRDSANATGRASITVTVAN